MRWAILVVALFLLTACSPDELPPLPEVPNEPVQEAKNMIGCDKRTNSCENLWDPVCGEDKVTYNNKCFACANQEINFYEKGACNDEVGEIPLGARECSPERPDNCVEIANVVCGSDGQTYDNECFACANHEVSYTTTGAC